MKKIIALVLALVMALSLVACGEKGPKTAEYKLGMGVVLNMDSSKAENAQVDATVAAVALDAEGKIVACRIDVAQSKMAVVGGAVDTAATFKTKMELGDAYGMAGKVDNDGDGVMLEWYEQAKAFEEYVVGKTAADVKAIETTETGGHMIAVDTELLSAGCSMQITDFIAAVAKACEDEQGQSFSAAEFKLGVAAATVANESTAAAADKDGEVKMYTDYAAVAVDGEGKILAAVTDATQPKILVNTMGDIVETSFQATKRELKEGYNMATYGANMDNNGDGKVLEWYVQADAFVKHVVGMTAADVTAMQTQEVNGHLISVDEDLLSAGCTIQIGGMQTVIANACGYAR